MTGTERDYEAEKRLREERARAAVSDDTTTDRIRRPRRGTAVDQVADLEAASDGTPVEEFEDISTGMTEIIAESPAAMALWHKIEKEKRARANSILKAMGKRPPAEVMSKLEKTIRNLKWIIIAIAIPAGSSAILVGKYLYTKGVDDEKSIVDRQHQTEQLDQLEKDARAAIELANRNAQRLDDLQREADHRRAQENPPPKVLP